MVRDDPRAPSQASKADLVCGCNDGTLVFVELNPIVKTLADVKGLSIATTESMPKERIKFGARSRLPGDEPITQVIELEGPSQAGMILCNQINGYVTVVSWATQARIIQVGTIPQPSSMPNILYYACPYGRFHYEHNPVLVVLDRALGLYVINLKSNTSCSIRLNEDKPRSRAKAAYEEMFAERSK